MKRTKEKKLIWTADVSMQNFLGERGFWPKEEDYYSDKVGYESSPEIKDAMESYYIRKMFYSNR